MKELGEDATRLIDDDELVFSAMFMITNQPRHEPSEGVDLYMERGA